MGSSNALSRIGPDAGRPARPSDEEWTSERLRLLRDTLAKGASERQLELVAQVSRAMELSVFTRQLHAVVYQGQLSIQIGIDGLRLIALRSGAYRGQEGPLWCGRDGVWTDVWLDDAPPAAAKVGIYRDGFPRPVWAVCLYQEFKGSSSQWRERPAHMLAVRAESHALRKAFQQEIAGAARPALERGLAVGIAEEEPDPPAERLVDRETGELLDAGPDRELLLEDAEGVVPTREEALARYREAARRARALRLAFEVPTRSASTGELVDATVALEDRIDEAERAGVPVDRSASGGEAAGRGR